jgi:hypothetical protein
LTEDQFSLALPLLATTFGVAVMVTVAAIATFAVAAPVPPGPVHVRVYAVAMVMAACTCVPLVAREPAHPPDAVQAVASVEDQVSVVAPPLATLAGLAVRLTTGGDAACMIVTFAVAAAVPPTPLQLSVKLVAIVRAVMFSVPLGPRAPLQPPDATHPVVALVDDQVNVVLSPLVTMLGFAVSVTVVVGAGATATLAVAAAVPPGPVHVSVNADDIVTDVIISLPRVGRAPDQLPEAVQPVASVVAHIKVVVPPLATLAGVAVIVTVGVGAIATLAVAAAMPPAPLHVSM